MIDTVIDIYHGNSLDWDAVIKSGVVAIVHKATQGTSFRDPEYLTRKKAALARGLKWGAYHFSSGSNVTKQVDNFLSVEDGSDRDILIALDFEKSTDNTSDMTLAQAQDFVTQVEQRTGRYPLLYGGDLVRDALGGKAQDPILKNCPLWYVRYSDTPKGIPTATWPNYTLWQYTDGNSGSDPKTVPGCPGADRNRYAGTTDELLKAWPFS